MRKYLTLFLFLLSCLTITGVSFIDDKLWDIVAALIGSISFGIIGIMYSFGFLETKNSGKNAYAVVFITITLCTFILYYRFMKFQTWILSWPLAWKIIIPVILGLLAVGSLILVIKHWNDYEDYHE